MPRSRSSAGVQQLLSTSGQPVFALNDSRVIVGCNAACLAWLGTSETELVGQRCDYRALPGDEADNAPGATWARALCPPPTAWHERATASFVLEVELPSGAVSRRQADSLRLGSSEENPTGMIVVVSPHELPDSTLDDHRTPNAEELHRQLARWRRAWDARYAWEQLVGTTPGMQRCRELARLAVSGRVSATIAGPPGSGREHLARSIHRARRGESDSPIFPLSCSAVPVEQWESTLTRIVRGTSRPDDAVTLLFLDADQLTLDAQAVVARFLTSQRTNIHLLATSQQSLRTLAKTGIYREDLATTLELLTIELPPLSTRSADVPLLAQAFVEEWSARTGRQVGGLLPEALDQLANYSWPGNLDELREVLHLACDKAVGPWVTCDNLPAVIRQATDAKQHPQRVEEAIQLDAFLVEVETELLQRAVKRARGNKAKAARLLGISRARLHRRLKELKIE